MKKTNPDDLWFSQPDTHTLCRLGGNGPAHPSQLYAIKKYVGTSQTFLDYGCGSGTTAEALLNEGLYLMTYENRTAVGTNILYYKGVDIIPKNIDWCKQKWSTLDFEVNPTIHKIDQLDKSFDVVYSRHVVDHMNSFENALDEHCRVAKKLVIIVLWRPLLNKDEHEIKNIVEQGKVYPDEYTNDYSRVKVMEALKEKQDWKVVEIAEDVGSEVKGHDVVIVLKHA